MKFFVIKEKNNDDLISSIGQNPNSSIPNWFAVDVCTSRKTAEFLVELAKKTGAPELEIREIEIHLVDELSNEN